MSDRSQGTASGPVVHPADPADAPAVRAIYAHQVMVRLSSGEWEPPDEPEMRRRMAELGHRFAQMSTDQKTFR